VIPSEKGKGASKPTVNFMQGQLLVWRLHNGLKKGGQLSAKPNGLRIVTKRKRKSGEREKEREK
jgi:hypothetical protein